MHRHGSWGKAEDEQLIATTRALWLGDKMLLLEIKN